MRFLNSLAAVAVLAGPAMAADPVPSMTVTGEGQVQVAPDMATVMLGVTNDAASARAALDANSKAVAALLKELAASGIEARDIQTSGLSLGPRIDYSSGGASQKVVGYTASNMVTVEVRALDRLGGILDSVVNEGANTLSGISFGLQDPVPATDEARKAAVADAGRKAALYAAAAGVRLGKVLSIAEAGGQAMPMPMAAGAFAKDAAAVPVSAGQLSVGASVSVVYELAE
ncbi:MAG: SIMPL domain-containing protein [Proteobacteria bacterium]|nr:SIMPL domain-containing protein [Pseudomonadota bacterium]MBS0574132.1 SIMPL domain-containing protein [Pseudomonadota bacterium]